MYNKYVINKGENLRSVARKFNISEKSLMNLNNIAFPDMLREGFEIVVPENIAEYFDYYTVNTGDSLYAIANRYNINPELLSALNGLDLDDYIYPAQKIMIPKVGYSYYITKEGDTIELVAEMFKTSKDSLIKQNPTIYLNEGQLLVNKSR